MSKSPPPPRSQSQRNASSKSAPPPINAAPAIVLVCASAFWPIRMYLNDAAGTGTARDIEQRIAAKTRGRFNITHHLTAGDTGSSRITGLFSRTLSGKALRRIRAVGAGGDRANVSVLRKSGKLA